MSSEDRFGFEWAKYSQITPKYELQFKRWVHPLGPADFKDKKVLDAGCGMGRNSYWSLKWGAAELSAFDFDRRSVEAAKNNLQDFKNASVFFQSIYDITWEKNFDLVFSIGVIHHLDDPRPAIRNLVRSLKNNGRLLIWVYSYEGNEWIVRLVSPLRKNITSRMPVSFVYCLSFFCSIPLRIFLKLYRGENLYLKQLAGFKFWHVHSIVFDQLIPRVANYWTREQVETLMKDGGLEDVKVFRPENNCGWTAVGIKK